MPSLQVQDLEAPGRGLETEVQGIVRVRVERGVRVADGGEFEGDGEGGGFGFGERGIGFCPGSAGEGKRVSEEHTL